MQGFLGLLCASIIVAVNSLPINNKPNQIHIALAGRDANGDPNGMAVSYHTNNATTATQVKYGITSKLYTKVMEGNQQSYYETFHHHVVLEDLLPATKYFYVVGSDADGWSKEYFFKSAPTATSLRSNYSFLFFADLGSYNGEASNAYVAQVKDSVELILHGGDVGYADDSFLHLKCATNFCYEDAYNDYMKGMIISN